MTQGVILWQTFALTIRHLAAPRLRTVDIGVTVTISQTNQQTLPAFARVFTHQFATIFITHISFRILASSEKLTGLTSNSADFDIIALAEYQEWKQISKTFLDIIYN